VVAAAIPDAMLLPTDECFAQEVSEHVYDGLSYDCKLDLVTKQGNLTGDQYIRDVLQPVFVPHFDNHPLATRPVHMDDKGTCKYKITLQAHIA
jgi:hypothetical protein